MSTDSNIGVEIIRRESDKIFFLPGQRVDGPLRRPQSVRKGDEVGIVYVREYRLVLALS